MTKPLVLDWDLVAQRSRGVPAPVFLRMPHDSVRRIAISCLASERATRGDRILWLGAQHVARPLAWMSALRERRMDARPLRPELGESPWPGVNPMDLAPEYLASWLISVLGLPASERTGVSEAIRDMKTSGAALASWSSPTFSEGTEHLSAHGLPIPEGWSHGRRPAGVRESTTLELELVDLTVVCGHPTDLIMRTHETLLVLLAFLSHARRQTDRKHTIVIDDWRKVFPPDTSSVAAGALLSAATVDGVRVIGAMEPDSPVETGSPALQALIAGSLNIHPSSHPGCISVPGDGPGLWDSVEVNSPIPDA